MNLRATLWKYEVQITAPSIPWLREGSVIRLTGLLAEDGVTPIPLPPMLVYDCAPATARTSGNPGRRISCARARRAPDADHASLAESRGVREACPAWGPLPYPPPRRARSGVHLGCLR